MKCSHTLAPPSRYVPVFLSMALAGMTVQRSAALVFWNNGVTADWFGSSGWYGGEAPASNAGQVSITSGNAIISRTDLGTAYGDQLQLGGSIYGSVGTATLAISDGGDLESHYAYIGNFSGSSGSITLDGTGSTWTNTNAIYFGNSGGNASLSITNGGTFLSTGYTFIGYGNGTASITVSGSGSLFQASGVPASLGYSGGTGTLTLANGGTAKFGSSGDYALQFSQDGTGTGTLNIGTGGTAGTLLASSVEGSGGSTSKVNFNHNESAYTFAIAINGNIAVEQKGSGTTLLTAASTYTGGTTITAGKLVVNNTSGSATGTGDVLAQANSTLAGNGTIGGAITMLGTFAPGNSVGKLNTGSLTIGATGTYTWEMNNASGTAGTTAGGWDLANITGTLTFQLGATLTISSLGLDNLAGQATNFNPLADYLWTIATTTDGVTGAGNVTLDTSAFQNAAPGTFSLLVSGNDLQLRYEGGVTVPEPSTFLALIAGSPFVLRRKRTR
ncbi:MAG: hypothetical protein QM755_24020 [Luteolibacter sp.]